MGSGKTFVGKALAQLSGFSFVDTDDLIEKKAGNSISDIFSQKGEDHFRKLESEICRELPALTGTVIATGGGIIQKKENRELLRQAGQVYFLESSIDHILNRIGNDKNRPLLNQKTKREKDLSQYERMHALLTTRAPLYKQTAHDSINSDIANIQEIAETIWTLYSSTIK
ncbi:shikimate kinase [Thermoproteota archaeon]